MTKFAVVNETPIPDPDADAKLKAAAAQHAQASQVMLLALRTISQRFIIACSALFTAGALFSAWWLWSAILPEPTVLQLVGLGMYAVFILAVEFIRRK